jgi:hypothetical protein
VVIRTYGHDHYIELEGDDCELFTHQQPKKLFFRNKIVL